MTNVRVVTSDSKIWHPEKTYLEIVHASQQGSVRVNLLSEGPCCHTAGIDDMLNSIVNKFGFDPNLYTIITSNQLSSSQYREHRTSWSELELAKKHARQSITTESTLKNRFAMFIGRSNWQRLGLASYLWTNYNDCTTMTYHFDPSMDYHVANFGLEELILKEPSARPNVYRFIEQLPIRAEVMSYPILWNQGAFTLEKYYQDIFCEIVCETYFTGQTFFLTEKTLRCIINRRPFMVQGPKWFLRNLRTLGFKTFDQWWCEGYDEDPADSRYESLCYNIDTIARASAETIKKWYQEMQPILEHNIQVLQQLTDEKLLGTEFYYE